MGKYDKFLGRSRRLPGWVYRNPGYYFVTIVTKDRIPYFGYVLDDEMYLSDAGIIAQNLWESIPSHFSHAMLDYFVIMPNHIHGIIILSNTSEQPVSSVMTLHATSLQEKSMGDISPKRGSLSTIIRSYKSAVTRQLRQEGLDDFAWLSRFHDHIIRVDVELDHIREYIQNNPILWQLNLESPDRETS